ncbi:ATP-binding cassette domain-containing protein [Oceanithermus profundus]
MIRSKGLVRRYPGFELTVEALEVPPGRFVTVIGPSGAGKSTLLRLLAGLERPDRGRVELQGRAVFLDQDRTVLERSVLANATFGLELRGVRRREAARRVRPWLERVGLADKLAQPAVSLSGGERARLALVRALAIEPDVLFLDEPTQALDPGNVDRVEGLLREAHGQGRTIVLVTHNLYQARRLGQETWFLLGGRIVERAPSERLFVRPREALTRAYVAGEMVY